MKTIYRFVLYMLILCFMIFCHELTHYQIDQLYDCDNIHWGFEKTGFYVSGTCPPEARLPNSINEIVMYNIEPLLLAIIVLLIEKD